MKTQRSVWLAAIFLAFVCSIPPASAELRHRYSFTSNANDSLGIAHGTLEGAATAANGAVVLDGSDGTFVNLPGGLIKGYPAVTLEGWATFGVNGNWSRLFDFGDTNPESGNGRNYLFLTPHSGAGDTRLAISDADPGFNNEQLVARPGVLDDLGKTHLAAVVDPAKGVMALYINGAQAASINNLSISLDTVSDAFCYLGKSLYAPDAYLTADIDEFRIYDTALTPIEIGVSYSAGPDNPQTDPGRLQSIAVEVDPTILLGGFSQVSVFGSYAAVADVNLSGVSGIEYQSSAPSAVTVTTNGLLQAVGLGTAVITATYQGQQASASVKVVQPQAQLKHRYSFNDAPGSSTVVDSVGGANGTLMGGASLNGDGMVTLDGSSGYVDLPNGIISQMTNATFEAWVTWNADSVWQRVFDFGNNSAGEDQAGTGQTYLFLTPRNGVNNVVRFAITTSSGGGERPILNGRARLPLGKESYLAVVYNASARIAKLYVDGALVASGTATIALRSIRDVNNWLGRSNWPDPYFDGQINEFRIYEGALTDFEVALSAAAGTEKVGGTNPGNLESISLESTNQFVLGSLAFARITAAYANVTGVDITANENTTLQSSNPSVVAVGSSGALDAVGTGTATITASYLGKQSRVTVTVAPGAGVPEKAELLHRYSFSETSGTTVKDSAGTADGTVVGTASFTGTGQLSLPGGAANSSAGYVDLPNGIISLLTNATFEAWVTWRGPSGSFWQRIFDFGNNIAGEDAQGTGDTYLFLSPRGGANVTRFAITLSSGGAGEQSLDGPALFPVNQETHVAVTYNYVAGNARLFINGKRVGTRSVDLALTSLNDINNWLGRSNWPDPFFNGLYNEFRIYNGTLTDAEVAAAYAAGPDRLASDVIEVSLTAARAGANLVLSWPVSAAGFGLESSASLGSTAQWETVSGPPVMEGGLNKVTIGLGGGTRFYRLKR